jgi:RNA 3'-terminal phosphate cyclase (ATP)
VLTIDGAQGEGGGQILRTALTLSTCLDKPFRIINIRANRRRPGLQYQHLAAVRAAAEISQANVAGAVKDSLQLEFIPGRIRAGNFHIDIGTAGSTSLVLQTVMPALMLAPAPSKLTLDGGTHNPLAPPFEFLNYAFLPLVNRMGPQVHTMLVRRGFAPEGGGRLHANIEPVNHLKPLNLIERGEIVRRWAEVILVNLPLHIAERELAVVRDLLSLDDSALHYITDTTAAGAGNLVSIMIESSNITECFTAFGKRGLPAEQVAEMAVKDVKRYVNAGVAVGPHLADQLLVLIALAGNSSFVTMRPSLHTLTNISVIKIFTGVQIIAEQTARDCWKIYCS